MSGESEIVIPIEEEELELHERPIVREEPRVSKTEHQEQRAAAADVQHEEVRIQGAATARGPSTDPDKKGGVTIEAPPRRPRLGLCCAFASAPIKFRTTTARYLSSLAPPQRRRFLGQLVSENAGALDRAIAFCARHGIGAFRVPSQLFPSYTHPDVGYRWSDLPAAAVIASRLALARARAGRGDIRLSFHPDQFVVPGSANPAVVRSSLAELEYQAELAELIGAEQLTIHGGGAQGGKDQALARLRRGLDRLSPRARRLVVLENDDRVYTPRDLLPLCRAASLRFVYDVHHHRCLADGLSVEQATAEAAATWRGGEPWFHASSPAQGWRGGDPRPHHDRLWLRDVPVAWRTMRATIDVEAKAKERAVLPLLRALGEERPRGAR